MPGRSPRVLLADPKRSSRQQLQRQLEGHGYEVQAVTTGADVVLKSRFDSLDVLILDVDLPDLDGFEVCAIVRHHARDSDPARVMMADVDDDLTRAYLGQMVDYAGGDYFFAKPCDYKLLLRLLDGLRQEEAKEDRPRCWRSSPTRAVWPTTRVCPAVSSA